MNVHDIIHLPPKPEKMVGIDIPLRRADIIILHNKMLSL